MKKILLYGWLLWLFFLSNSLPAFTQARSKQVSIEHFILGTDVPSSIMLQEIYMGRLITPDAVNNKIQTAFEETFVNVDNSEWYGLDKHYKQFAVRFSYSNNQSGVAVFTKSGYLIYSAVSITENQLPENYSRIIHADFNKYTIVDIMQLTIDRRLLWLVELQDARYNILFVHLEDGVLNTLNRYDCKKIRYRKKDTVPLAER